VAHRPLTLASGRRLTKVSDEIAKLERYDVVCANSLFELNAMRTEKLK
jgi:hypothetical protein